MPSICVTTTRTWEAFPTLDYYRTTKSGGRLEAFVMRNTGAGLLVPLCRGRAAAMYSPEQV